MGRRMVECKTWKSYQVGQLTYRQRVLWIGLISTADDQGRGYAHPGIVRGAIFPYDDLTNDELQADIDALADAGLILLYAGGDGQPLYQIIMWWRYQRPTWAWPSDLPAPDGWSDREKYREGNEIIENGWDSEGGFVDSQSDPTVTPLRPHSDPTVTPLRPHSDPSVSPAPSGSTSTRGSNSITNGDASASATPPKQPNGTPRHLRGWLELVRESKNRPATSRLMIEALYPYYTEADLPDYGRIGATAKRVSGWGRLIQYIWGLSQYEPQGDLMSYIETVHKNGGKASDGAQGAYSQFDFGE